MNELDEAKVLFAAARRDLNALLGMLRVEDLFSDEIFGLHVQQAVEKFAKAWLVILDKPYPRIHNLDALLRLLERADCDVTDYLELTEFTPFGTQFRYEALIGDSDNIDREAAIYKVQSLCSCVETELQIAEESKADSNEA